MSKPQAAKELGLSKSTALKWASDRRTRPLAQQKLGRPRLVTNEHISQMINWITGHYDRRILPLQTIAKEACSISASYRTLVRAWARWGYHHHTPDSKPFLTKAQKLQRFTFAIKHWDQSVEILSEGHIYGRDDCTNKSATTC